MSTTTDQSDSRPTPPWRSGWRERLAVWVPWILLEILIAAVFMTTYLSLAIEDNQFHIDFETCAYGAAYGAMIGGSTLAVIAFSVAIVAASIDWWQARVEHDG